MATHQRQRGISAIEVIVLVASLAVIGVSVGVAIRPTVSAAGATCEQARSALLAAADAASAASQPQRIAELQLPKEIARSISIEREGDNLYRISNRSGPSWILTASDAEPPAPGAAPRVGVRVSPCPLASATTAVTTTVA